MIFLIVQYGVRPVHLFCDDEPHELMREGEGGEGQLQLRPLQHGGIDAECSADQYDQLPCAGIGTLLEKIGQLRCGHCFPSFVERQQIVLRLQHIQYDLPFLLFQFRDGKTGRLLYGGDQLYRKIGVVL